MTGLDAAYAVACLLFAAFGICCTHHFVSAARKDKREDAPKA